MAEIFLKPMNTKEITQIYESRMRYDFPVQELKPLENIIEMMERGVYESLSVNDGNEQVGYALVLLVKESPYGLLDYLGIFPKARNRGYGGGVLSALAEHYRDRTLMIESEHPGDAPDERMAERRLCFYRRNGAVDTGVESMVYGAHYINFILLCGNGTTGENAGSVGVSTVQAMPSDAEIKEILERLYREMIPDEEKRKKYLRFWIAHSENGAKKNGR